jgi:translation elongation factor EF-G
VLRETAREGGGVFSVHAHLPAQGALGLADDLRARSSGAASASLLLSHWERLPVDPFFAPKTEVEREELGEEGQGGGGGGPSSAQKRQHKAHETGASALRRLDSKQPRPLTSSPKMNNKFMFIYR